MKCRRTLWRTRMRVLSGRENQRPSAQRRRRRGEKVLVRDDLLAPRNAKMTPMKAVLLNGHGGFDQLEYRDDVPTPAPRAGEVLIRVGAAGVNNTDINTRTAWYSRSVTEGTTAEAATSGIARARAEDAGWTGSPPAFPRIQGADACGCIVAVGEGVDSQRIGERVLVEPVFRVADAAGQIRPI